MHVLDNPIWNALTTEQTALADRDGDAARFPPEVTALAGMREPHAIDALARLIADGRTCGLLLDDEITWPRGIARVDGATCAQMVHEGKVQGADPLEELGPADAPAMLALAKATQPGPFGTRTHELGAFLGIRAEGRLVAMAGQRMRLPGMIEISGVCTDPAHAGRGHAARLMAAQLARIRSEGAAAFLHVRADNARAIALYERLGFRIRRELAYVIVRAA